MISVRLFLIAVLAMFLLQPSAYAASDRRIEEIVVTAERKESSVQDTSISITAFTTELIEDFGIQNQSDLQNMIPATTIQPYDSAIRGVGRNFRNLGGDPGVATYINSIYSEDLYTATIGSLWDIKRIEVLRGPQGTLYGRNAVGGAMNFIYNKPADEFDVAAKTILGDYGLRDVYGMINGPLIKNVLNARLTGSSRRHDGWVEERSGLGPDLDSGDERNAALSLEWIINDRMLLNVRQNKADVERVMGGADGAGLVVLNGEFPTGTYRDFTHTFHSIRAVDATVTDPTDPAFLMPGQEVFNYTNPTTGATILAQRNRPGVDPGSATINFGRSATYSNTECVFLDRDNIDGDDVCAYTNGLNKEWFDQQGTQLEFSWDISPSLQMKYLFGYNTLLYERNTDDDNVASVVDDRQFYVNHEAEYVSHELQLFWDLGTRLTFTSGLFFYDSVIDQRYDFYSSTGQENVTDATYALDTILATVAPGAVPGDPPLTYLFATDADYPTVDIDSAKEIARRDNVPVGDFVSITGPWLGDATFGSVQNGLGATLGSDLHSSNMTSREAYAVYTQGVWDINDQLTLTFGVRYAEDDVHGEEQLAQFAESGALWSEPGDPFYGLLDLLTVNVLRGAISPTTLQPTGLVAPWLGGVPITFGAFREVERVDNDTTYRLNLDYDIRTNVMLYGNVTTGYRSGGFNLAFFSQTPQYEPEELTAYEVGMKGQFADDAIQLNAAAYLYDYKSIHTATQEACPVSEPPGGFQSACSVAEATASVQAAPGAEVKGFEVEGMWLVNDALTLGGNFSYTSSEYTDSFVVVDGADPTVPSSIYDATNEADRGRDIKGNQLLQVPKTKASAWATYRFVLDSGTVDLLANYSYIDEVYYSAFESALDRAPSYDRLDLRATWTSASGVWNVTGFVNNVLDEIGIRQILRGGAAEGYRRTAQVTEPRVYGVEVRYDLGG